MRGGVGSEFESSDDDKFTFNKSESSEFEIYHSDDSKDASDVSSLWNSRLSNLHLKGYQTNTDDLGEIIEHHSEKSASDDEGVGEN